MRVITGEARGRKLVTLEGDDVRPTTDRVKEGMFNIIQFDLENSTVLDLFAGSGQLGIEALSRGARRCVFVDASSASLNVVKQNLTSTGLMSRASVFLGDSLAYLRHSSELFDIVLLDPPYNKGLINEALPLLSGRTAEGAVIVCETSSQENLPEKAGELQLYREYKYGKIKLTVYKK